MFYELAEYGKTLSDDMPKNYESAKVHYIINIDSATGEHQYISTAYTENKKTLYKRYNVPSVIRGGKKVKPKFYCDNGQYIFGMDKKNKPSKNTAIRHNSYCNVISRLNSIIDHPYTKLVDEFMNANNMPPENAKDSDLFLFSVDGNMLVDLPEVKSLWAKEQTIKEGHQYQCIICGDITHSRETIPAQSIIGGKKCIIFSVGKDSYESYGKSSASNIAVCSSCEENVTRAINYTVSSPNNHIIISDETYIFWDSAKNKKNDFMSFLTKPQPGSINQLIKSVYSGNTTPINIDYTPFYLLSLRAKKRRIAITSAVYSTVQKMQSNIANFFNSQKIGDDYYCGLFALASATVHDTNQLKTNTKIMHAIFDFAIARKKLPYWIAKKVLNRIESEQKITRPHIALINAWLVSHKEIYMEEKIGLDENKNNIGYLCGRLLAELDSAQRAAISGINSSVGERYYKVASSRPARIFPRLIEGAMAHLAKRTPAQLAIAKRISEISEKIQDAPDKLSCTEKMFFALGYFHQQQCRRHDKHMASVEINKQKKENKETKDD